MDVLHLAHWRTTLFLLGGMPHCLDATADAGVCEVKRASDDQDRCAQGECPWSE